MTAQTLIAIDPAALQGLRDEIAALRRSIEGVSMTPRPEWLTVADYAAFIGKSQRTVKRMVDEGKVETKHVGHVRLVKI